MIKGRNLFYEKFSPLKPLFQKFGVLNTTIIYKKNIRGKHLVENVPPPFVFQYSSLSCCSVHGVT